jgi:putative ATP-dependent endonuclease of OLD family
MIIKNVRIRNFRCIRDEALECESLTVLVGPNGSGKSSFLRAIDLFYTLAAKISEEDFYARNTSQPIIITVTFIDLTDEEKSFYMHYLENDSLTVEKEIRFPGGRGNEKYFGSRMRNPDFQGIRSAGSASGKRDAYSELRQREQYSELSTVSRAEDIGPILEEWERDHPDQCRRMRDEGQFFGFREVGSARLERFTSFIPVPAVKDASEDATEGRGSPITQLVDRVVRQVLEQKPDLQQFRSNATEEYKNLMDEKNLPELPQLADDLTKSLQVYVADAQVNLHWQVSDFNIPNPIASTMLVEDGFEGDVSRKGHGLQRAFILTLLQYLAVIKGTKEIETQEGATGLTESNVKEKSGSGATPSTPNLVIAIEEPELYQHPNRQRHLAKVFLQLSQAGLGSREGGRIQMIYSTHSPIFVGIERIDQVRLLRKEGCEDNLPKKTRVKFTTMAYIARKLEEATGKPTTAASIQSRLVNVMSPWVNEGFFADIAVLVEGESDRAAIVEVAKQTAVDFEKTGISVIPVMGKTKLDRPHLIFTELGISTYIVFDSDKSKGKDGKPDTNKLLLKLCGHPEEEFPKTSVRENMACFEENLPATLREEIGDQLYKQLLNQYSSELGYSPPKEGEKNPLVISNIVEEAYKRGINTKTLEDIVKKIVALKRGG